MIHPWLSRVVGLTLLALGTGAVADPTLALLQQQDRLLRQPTAAPSPARASSGDTSATRERHQAERRQWRRHVERSAPALARKLGRLEALELLRERRPEAFGLASEVGGPRVLIDGADAPGRDCAHPLQIGTNERVRVALGDFAGETARVWLRWQAPAAGAFFLSSRESGIDSTLAAYADCGDAQPAVEDDDSFGLAAELLLTAGHSGQIWWIEAGNLGDAGELTLQASTTRSISGRVTDEATGLPIADLGVSLHDAQGYLWSTETGLDGRYQVSIPDWTTATSFHVRTGSYWSSSGQYLHEAWSNQPCVDPSYYYLTSCGPSTAITLGADGTRSGIDFALRRGAVLDGRVLDQTSGSAVEHAEITLYDGNGNRLHETYSDVAGRFRFGGLLPGGTVWAVFRSTRHQSQMYNGVACEPWWCDTTQATPIALSMASTSIEVRLHPHSYIELALSVGGDPAEFADIDLLDASGDRVDANAQWLGDGHVRIGPVAAGDHRLRVRADRVAFTQLYGGIECASDCRAEIAQGLPISVAGNGERVAVSMDLRRLPTLVGRLTADDGAPIANARVLLYRIGYSSYSYWANASTDGFGYYRIGGVEPGSYYLYASAERFVNQLHAGIACESTEPLLDCPLAQAITYDLSGTDKTIDFVLAASPTVTGTLSSEGEPLTGDIDHLHPGVELLRNDLSRATFTLRFDTGTGRYELSDFNSGSYYIGAAVGGHFRQLHPMERCSSTFHWYGCDVAAAVPVMVGGAGVVIDFDLLPGAGRRIRVVDAVSGAPVPGVAIDLWDAEGRSLGSALSSASGRALVHADSWGTITARLSSDNYSGYVDQVYDRINCNDGSSVYRGGCSLAGASTISLPNTDPDAAVIEFALHKSLTVFDDGFE